MIIDELLLLGICLFLPLSIYFNYSTYVKSLELKENSIILEFSIIVSLLLMLKYDKLNNIYSLIILMLPIIISFIRKKYYLSLILFFCLISIKKINISIIINPAYLLQAVTLFIIYLYLIIYFLKLGNNIIDLSKIQKELEREKLLRTSISKLTHELKNPIAVCNGYLEMININNKEKAKRYLNIITNEIKRSKTIIDEFSSYGKLKKIDKEEIDIMYLLEDTVFILKPLFKQNKATINISSRDEVYISADYNKLKQVFINLLKNTIEAKKDTVPLDVKVVVIQNKKQVTIKIIDNGIGMNKETLNKVLDVFFTTKPNGTGIGLAFSKEVIELHKGTMNIKSKQNEGTEIKITLPK